MNKVSGDDGIPVELFQILEDNAEKVLHLICKFGKLSSGHGTRKGQFSLQSKEEQCQRMFKLPHNCTYLTRQQSNAQNSPSQTSIVCEP